MATSRARRRRAIERLIATDFARDRLARAVFDVVTDGLDLGPIAVRTADDRAWVRRAITDPIQHAADHALERLVLELIDALSTGRPDLVDQLLAAAGEDEPDEPAPTRRREPTVAAVGPLEGLVTIFASSAPAAVALDPPLDLQREPAPATADEEAPMTSVAVLR